MLAGDSGLTPSGSHLPAAALDTSSRHDFRARPTRSLLLWLQANLVLRLCFLLWKVPKIKQPWQKKNTVEQELACGLQELTVVLLSLEVVSSLSKVSVVEARICWNPCTEHNPWTRRPEREGGLAWVARDIADRWI